MPPIQQIIQGLVAPVVLISANGLICLALYNRLSNITSRTRAFHKEWFDLFAQLSAKESQQPATRDGHYLAERIKILDELGHHSMVRARLVRDSLYCLLASVFCLLGCSMGLGVALLLPIAYWLALAAFYLGVVVMMAGIVFAALELQAALDPLMLEHEMIEHIDRDVTNSNGSISTSP